MSTKDFRTRNEIIISIKGKSQAEVDAPNSRKGKGSVPPGKPGKRFLKRRVPETGAMKWFDLGYMKNAGSGLYENMSPMSTGSTIDDSVYASFVASLLLRGIPNAKGLDPLIPSWAPFFGTNGYVPMQLFVNAGLNSYDNAGSLYAPGPSHSDKWTATGLKLTADDVAAAPFVIGTHDNFAILVPDPGDPTTRNKITAVNSFAAPAVPFTPARGMQVYIVPQLFVLERESHATFYPTSGPEVDVPVVVPPIIATTPPEQRYVVASPYFQRPIFGRWLSGSSIIGADIYYFQTWNSANNGIPGYSAPSLFSAVAYWPVPPGSPNSVIGRTIPMSATYGGGGTDTSTNPLVFIIKQNNSTFYVWKL